MVFASFDRLRTGSVLAFFGFFLINILSAVDRGEEVVELKPFAVTGTHLRSFGEATLVAPLVVSAEDLRESGAVSMQDYFDALPQAQLNLLDRDVLGYTPGATGINLRGAGIQYTLTLINGRRAASYAIGGQGEYGFVNVASFPMAAIERVEVLPDSSSAIYGSDAVAGVVNFVFKNDFEGLESSVGYANTLSGDQAIYEISAMGGLKEGRLSATVGVSFTSTEALFARERDFSASGDQSARGGFDWTAFSVPRGSIAVVEDLSTGGLYLGAAETYTTDDLLNDRSLFDQNGFKSFASLRDEYGAIVTEPSDEISLSPSSERYGVYATLDFDLSDARGLFLELLGSRSEIENILHPAQIVTDEDLFVAVSQFNPYNPLGINRTDGGTPTDVGIYYRNVLAGPRVAAIDNTLLRIVGGLKGTLENAVQYEVSAGYSEDTVDSEQSGGFSRSATIAALTTSAGTAMDPALALNPFGRFAGGPLGGDDHNDAVVPRLRVSPTEEASFALSMLQGILSGELFELWSGKPLLFAVGGEFRREAWAYQTDAVTEADDVIQLGSVPRSSGERSVASAFVEWRVPLHERIDTLWAARYEVFDGSTGENLNPKVAVRYTVGDRLSLRASYGQGFRAPSLPELFSGERTSFAGQIGPDPARGGEIVANVALRSGGNSELEPEESENLLLGFVTAPTTGLRIGVDWSLMKIKNQIEADSLGEILLLNDSRTVRAAPTQADLDQGFAGRVVSINNFTRNKARSEIESLDLYVNYENALGRTGALQASLNFSHLLRFDSQLDANSAASDSAGGYLLPEYKAVVKLSWTKGSARAFSNLNYIGTYEQLFGQFTGNELVVDPFMTIDFGVRFEAFEVDLTLELINVFDEAPPFSDAASIGYDYLHSPVGRMYRIAAAKRF